MWEPRALIFLFLTTLTDFFFVQNDPVFFSFLTVLRGLV